MFVISFALGVSLRSFIEVPFPVLLVFLIASATLLGYAHIRTLRTAWLWLIPFLSAALMLGIVRYELALPDPLVLDRYTGEEIVFEGIVVRVPDRRDSASYLTVRVDYILDDEIRPVSELVRVSVDRLEPVQYGDRIKVEGFLDKPEPFETDAGRVFDYPSYLAKDGIYHEMYRPHVEVIGSGEGNFVISFLLSFKALFLEVIGKVIPEPESSLLGGLLLGEKHSLGDEATESFRRSGLVHIIVLSGYNMTIVAYAIMWLFRRLPKGLNSSLGVLGILGFTVMAGASATAVRAALMALLVILALVLKRDYDIRRALALAGFAMIVHNPKILVFDPSFQLSFLATLGIIYLSPVFARVFKWIPGRFGFREIVSATLATQLFVLPRLIVLSGSVSLVGVFSNIIVLPFIPATMLFGAATGAFGLVHTALALPFGYIAYALLHYVMLIAEGIGNVPFASVLIPFFPVWFAVLLYIGLGYTLIRARRV